MWPVSSLRVVVKTEREIRFRETRVEPVLQHRARAADRFLGRLADEQDRAVPLVLQLRQCARHADEGRDVHVVTAGVHDVHFLARVVFRHHLARIGQAGFLLDRQCIHVGAHEHDRAVAILHHADDAVTGQPRLVIFADVIGHLAAGGFEFLRDQLGRALFLGRQLGMAMHVLVNREQRRQLLVSNLRRRLICRADEGASASETKSVTVGRNFIPQPREKLASGNAKRRIDPYLVFRSRQRCDRKSSSRLLFRPQRRHR